MARTPDDQAIFKLREAAEGFQRLGIAMEIATEAQRIAGAGAVSTDNFTPRQTLIREAAHILGMVMRLDADAAP